MRSNDAWRYAAHALRSAPTRSLLVLLAISIAVTSVVLLTALGEGARRYVQNQFEQLGTDLLIVLPGRNETTGGAPPLLGTTPRDLTLDDAIALQREHTVLEVAPISLGSAPVSYQSREREVTVIGTSPSFFTIRRLTIAQGPGLPAVAVDKAVNQVVLGNELRQHLFGQQTALGQSVRIGDRRFRVSGILNPSGHSLGQDLDDMAIIPVASAQALFDNPSLFRILIQARNKAAIEPAKQAATEILQQRHQGELDVTIVTQDALLQTFDGILGALTYALGGIAAISLLVAGILIMNVMLISVGQRLTEIGLLKALGAAEQQVLRLFLFESLMLSLLGALLGLLLSGLCVFVIQSSLPQFPLQPPLWSPIAATVMAILSGLLFGVLPARRAARMDPVIALGRH